MALQRPPAMRTDQFLGQEQTEQQQILTELGTISEKVGRVELSGEMLRMNLLGDAVGGETKHGRLPRAEDSIANHESRLTELERSSIRWKAYGAAVGAISAVIGSVVTFFEQAEFHLVNMHN